MAETNISKGFRELRKLGYFARQRFHCCQSCAWASVPDHKGNKAVFYHAQDAQDLEQSGKCYVAWAGDGNQIVRVLRSAGVGVEWDGGVSSRIRISEVA